MRSEKLFYYFRVGIFKIVQYIARHVPLPVPSEHAQRASGRHEDRHEVRARMRPPDVPAQGGHVAHLLVHPGPGRGLQGGQDPGRQIEVVSKST